MWRKITHSLPYYISRRPDYLFKDKGWVNYTTFLST